MAKGKVNSINLVRFSVEGEPRPKQSFRVGGRGGYQPARIKAWQTEIAWEAERAMRAINRHAMPFVYRLKVDIVFNLGNERRVDLDNLSKAVLDGMNGIIYIDDRQIMDLHLRKRVVIKGEKAGLDIAVFEKVEE